jgi:nitroreductase
LAQKLDEQSKRYFVRCGLSAQAEDQIMAAVASPWAITALYFPDTGTMADKLRFFVAYAILAPSSHNTQPWRFHLSKNRIDLYADRTRALSVMDPDDRALVMSCGAALYNLRLAIRHFGYADTVTLWPDPNASDLVARVDVGQPGRATAEEHDLFWAIPTRRTNRNLYTSQAVPDIVVKRLETIARAEGATFRVVQGDDRRHAVADLIAEADRIQWSDKGFRRELAAWLHPERHHSRDGIPGYAFGVSEMVAYTGPFLLRTFDFGRGQAAKDRQLADGSPLLAVLETETDTPTAWLQAGQALERVLLQARAAGLAAAYLNQPIEFTGLRQRLGDVVGATGFPQLLLRMGHGLEVKPTPRRGVDEVIR